MTSTDGHELRYLFRVAAGPRIGFGHLMRARALARALGVRPLVALRGGDAAVRVAKGLGCCVVGSANLRADVVVVDDPSPVHAERWLRRSRRLGATTVAVRDNGIGKGPADLVVDGSMTRDSKGAAVRRLEGPSFSILDPSFARKSAASRAPVRRRVLVALGGGEHVVRLAHRVVRAIHERSSDARIQVAAGLYGVPHSPLPRASWIVRRGGLRRDLERCDVAVVSGGVTLYEACALGTPTVALPIVAGQRPAVRAAASRRAVLAVASDAGVSRIEQVGSHVATLLNNRSLRQALAASARRLVDGRGALRVAAAIKRIAGVRHA